MTLSFLQPITPKMQPVFLIVAPSYTHKSGGIRALYRLCHHLNSAGYPAAMTPMFERIDNVPDWLTPVHTGTVADSIVIYPEVVSGNPLKADKVVRWTLNNPGLLGGDSFYPDEEMVFTFNLARLPVVNKAVNKPLGPSRVLTVALIDPAYIYPDANVEKTLDCCFTHKGAALRARSPLPFESRLQHLEEITPSMEALGEALRRTRTLYSYDHASTVLKEAAVCGCRILVVHDDGQLLDPETCGCAHNVFWNEGFREDYARKFHDSSFIDAFVRELQTRWTMPPARRQAGLPGFKNWPARLGWPKWRDSVRRALGV
jgi:hypothetical protein